MAWARFSVGRVLRRPGGSGPDAPSTSGAGAGACALGQVARGLLSRARHFRHARWGWSVVERAGGRFPRGRSAPYAGPGVGCTEPRGGLSTAVCSGRSGVTWESEGVRGPGLDSLRMLLRGLRFWRDSVSGTASLFSTSGQRLARVSLSSAIRVDRGLSRIVLSGMV